MIRRICGIAVALAIVAIIVFASLGHGSYRSMLFDPTDPAVDPAVGPAPAADTADTADTARQSGQMDSLLRAEPVCSPLPATHGE